MKTKILPALAFYFLVVFYSYSQQEKKDLNYYVKQYEQADNINKYVYPLEFFEKDKNSSLLVNDNERAAYDLYYIAKIQYKFGDMNGSEKSAVEGLKLLDKLTLNDRIKRIKLSLYNHLGILNREEKNYNQSLNNYEKTINLSKKKWDSALAYNNIGVAYIYMGKYQKAKSFLLRSYQSFKQLKDSVKISLTLGNLGRVKAKLNERGALSDLESALKIKEKINPENIYENYVYLIEYFIDRKDSINALIYAKRGYDEAKNFNRLSYKYESLLTLIKLGETKYTNEYVEVFGKIMDDMKLKRNTYAEAKYNVDREKEKTLEEKTKRIEEESKKTEEKSKRILYQVIGGAVVLVAVLLFFVLRARHKKEKLETQFNTERHISKRLHDEVANDIFAMMSRLQNDPNTKKELIDGLEEVYLKTRDISKANAALDVSKDFDMLLKDLIASYKTADVKIFTRNISEIPWDIITNLKRETLYRVIQELMTNMKKHSRASLVTLQFEEKKNTIMVTYVDNGIGCELNYGNGLRNTENRMELAGGAITFESETNKGFQAKIIV